MQTAKSRNCTCTEWGAKSEGAENAQSYRVLERPVIYGANVEAPWYQVTSAEGGRVETPKALSGLAYEEVFPPQCTRGSGRCRKWSAKGAENRYSSDKGPLGNGLGIRSAAGNPRRLGVKSWAPKEGKSRRLGIVGVGVSPAQWTSKIFGVMPPETEWQAPKNRRESEGEGAKWRGVPV